jgi:hypothetical protein
MKIQIIATALLLAAAATAFGNESPQALQDAFVEGLAACI